MKYFEVRLQLVRGGRGAAGAGPPSLLAHHAEVHAAQIRHHLELFGIL